MLSRSMLGFVLSVLGRDACSLACLARLRGRRSHARRVGAPSSPERVHRLAHLPCARLQSPSAPGRHFNTINYGVTRAATHRSARMRCSSHAVDLAACQTLACI